jgi:hypothetical protein
VRFRALKTSEKVSGETMRRRRRRRRGRKRKRRRLNNTGNIIRWKVKIPLEEGEIKERQKEEIKAV